MSESGALDLRRYFPLGDYFDHVKIEMNYGINQTVTGRIRYRVNTHMWSYLTCNTRQFCDIVGMDDETTLIWVLKFGDKLPHYLNQLEVYSDVL